MPDSLRFAIGTLTRWPVSAPRRMDLSIAGAGIVLAPIIGALLGAVLGGLAAAVRDHTAGSSGLLLATLVIATLAYATRALHLDGLADTADALGSGKPAAQALEIARRSDIGPFGVVALVLVLLAQVVAYGGIVSGGDAILGLVITAGTARTALVFACTRGIPAARPDGLGAAVAGSVPRFACAAILATWLAFCLGLAAVLAPDAMLAVAAAVLAGLLAGVALLAICVRRLGGMTGDVLGAVVELSFATSLVTLALLVA